MDNTILLTFQSIAELLGWTILHSIWQIALIAIVLKILLAWTAKYDATIRYALSISALFVATFWSVHTFLGEYQHFSFVATSANDNSVTNTATTSIPIEITAFSPSSFLKRVEVEFAQIIGPMMPFLAIFWFIGISFFASRILVGLFRLHHFSTRGTIRLPSAWDTRLLTLQQLSGIYRPVTVRLSHLVESPITYRFFRPIVLLPISLFTHLSDEQIEVILLHELAHIKRQDYLVNLLQSCIEVLFFYHPLIWWMSKQVRIEREHCCDDRVMNLRHNPMLYAQTLTQMQGQHYSLKTKLAMSATGNTGDFSKRIYRLFEQKEPYATLRNSVAALLLLLLSGVMMAFYPNHPTPNIVNNNTPVIVVQDTVPKTQAKENNTAPQIWVAAEEELKTESKAAALQVELVTLERALHESVNALKTEKSKESASDEAKLEKLQLKAGELKQALHVKTQELKELTSSHPKVFRINANEGEALNLKMEGGLLTLKDLKGKNPIVYIDNKVYQKWKIDGEGTLYVDIPSEEVHSINVFKEEKATAIFGPDSKDGVIYINTKSNPNPEVIIEQKMKLHQADSHKKPLVVLDGKVTKQAVEDIDKDKIATINIFKDEAAIKKYGDDAKFGVVEIMTKDYASKHSSTLKGKIEGNSFTFKSDDPDKKPLIIIDGKVSQQKVEDLDADKIGTMSVLKGEAAIQKYGDQAKDGVVEIYTKGNEPADLSWTEKKTKIPGAAGASKSEKEEKIWIGTIDKMNDAQPLFIVDGKKLPRRSTSGESLGELSPDEIAAISVVKGEKALEKYGKDGENGVVEIITKGNKKALKKQEKEMKKKQKEKEVKMKLKEKEMKAQLKEKEAKKQALKAQQAELAGKAIQSPAAGLSVFPNPTRQLTNVQLNLKQRGNVKVDILNINGQVVLHLVNDTLDKGLHQFQWNSDNVPAGSYFVHFNLDGELMSKQVVVKK